MTLLPDCELHLSIHGRLHARNDTHLSPTILYYITFLSAPEATTIWRYTNVYIIIIIISNRCHLWFWMFYYFVCYFHVLYMCIFILSLFYLRLFFYWNLAVFYNLLLKHKTYLLTYLLFWAHVNLPYRIVWSSLIGLSVWSRSWALPKWCDRRANFIAVNLPCLQRNVNIELNKIEF